MEIATCLPPGPDSPSWQQAQAWIENPVDFWKQCHAQFGDVFTVQLGSLGSVVVFSDPVDVRQIFQLPAESYECRQYNEQYKYVMGDQSILVADRDRHRSRRRIVAPPLNRATFSRVPELCRRLTEELVDGWPLNEELQIRSSLHYFCARLMLELVFGDPSRSICQEIQRLYREEVLQDLGTWGPWRRFGRLQPRLRELIAVEIAARRECADSPAVDLLDVFARARDESGELLDDHEIADHVFTMLVAGVDPTAIALSWAVYWIHESCEVKETLLRELENLGTSPSASDILELPYLSAVCHEVLRMYPVVTTPTGRKLTKRVVIGEREFQPGVTLLPCTYLIHHRPDLYPDPDRFRPERFMENRFGSSEYLPFGGGSRTCIGATLAPVQMKIALATMLMRREFRLAHEGSVQPARHGTLLAPSDSMRVVITIRPK